MTAAASSSFASFAADEEWTWPEERPVASKYYNSALASQPPEPKRLSTRPVADVDDVSHRTTMVRNYAWSDDTSAVKVYVPVPGVVRDQVTVDIRADAIDMHAQTQLYGAFTMALRRLYDAVDVQHSSYKVLEKKEKVVITLAKLPSQRPGEDGPHSYRPWYRLHHDVTNNIDTVEDFEGARMARMSQMNAEPPGMPTMPTESKRRS